MTTRQAHETTAVRNRGHEEPRSRTRHSHRQRPVVPIAVVDLQVPLFRGEPRVTTRRSHPQGRSDHVPVSRGEPPMMTNRSDSQRAIVPARVVRFQLPVSHGEPRVPERRSHSQGTTAVARVGSQHMSTYRGESRGTTRRSDETITTAGVEDLMVKLNTLRILYKLKSAEGLILRSELGIPQEGEREAEAWLRRGGVRLGEIALGLRRSNRRG